MVFIILRRSDSAILKSQLSLGTSYLSVSILQKSALTMEMYFSSKKTAKSTFD